MRGINLGTSQACETGDGMQGRQRSSAALEAASLEVGQPCKSLDPQPRDMTAKHHLHNMVRVSRKFLPHYELHPIGKAACPRA